MSQRGNILFLILLAVVLFAALAYAVTSSMRGGGKDSGDEKASAQASSLLNYFAEMDAAVQRMMLSGVKDYELNFKTASVSTAYIYGNHDNTNCTDARCRVFEQGGGGVTGRDLSPFVRTPSTAVADTINTGRIMYINVPGVGTSEPDIVFSVQGVSQKMCMDINAKAGVSTFLNASYSPASTVLMYQNPVPVGSIPNSGNNVNNVPMAAALSGTFCTCRTAADWAACLSDKFSPYIFHVLVAR